jgi:hypothetical protein
MMVTREIIVTLSPKGMGNAVIIFASQPAIALQRTKDRSPQPNATEARCNINLALNASSAQINLDWFGLVGLGLCLRK